MISSHIKPCSCAAIRLANLGQNLGPVGQGDIIRRIVVNAGFGHLIHGLHSTAADYVDVSLTQLSQMHWRLTDEKGRVVNLKCHGISCSICFVENKLFKTVVQKQVYMEWNKFRSKALK